MPSWSRSKKRQITSDQQDEINRVDAEISLCMKHAENQQQNFVLPVDNEKIWSDPGRVATVLRPNRFSDEDIKVIQQTMHRILSCLILVNATECLLNFQGRLFKRGKPSAKDSDIPLEEAKLEFLDEEANTKRAFIQQQFVFIPEVIRITSDYERNSFPDQRRRLPFEHIEEDIGEGGYGIVSRVEISPHHICKPDDNNADWDKPYPAACKTLTRKKDFDDETNNLLILKKSSTNHQNVMQHLATIEHASKLYILLPYAQLRDLETFFYCGMGPIENRIYDFEQFFPDLSEENRAVALLAQASDLAGALKWLHNDITLEHGTTSVDCVHMDLKPSNILIDIDRGAHPSPVGKWKISDFGISVLNQKSKFVTVEDLSIAGQHFPSRGFATRPRREEGMYQAPEVKVSEALINQPTRLKRTQEGVTQKSDVWSYGCILSEILAFCLGKDVLVKEFHACRRKDTESDVFYEEVPDEQVAGQRYLDVPHQVTTAASYRVRNSVVEWLDKIDTESLSPRQWVNCFVGTLKKILVTDVDSRPDSVELLKHVSHVYVHVQESKTDSNLRCPIVPLDTLASGAPPHGGPVLTGANTDAITRNAPPLPGSAHSTTQTEPAGTPANRAPKVICTNSEGSYFSSHSPRPDSLPDADDPDHAIRRASFQKQPDTHGIKNNPDRGRSEPTREVMPLPTNERADFKAVSVASNTPGHEVSAVYLMKESICVYTLNHRSKASLKMVEKPIEPTNIGKWSNIALAGYFVAVWGVSSDGKGKIIHLYDIHDRNSTPAPLPRDLNITMLARVVVSERGIAALMFDTKLAIVTIGSSPKVKELSTERGQHFADIAFNDAGNLLFAWAYGRPDTLYVYRYREAQHDFVKEVESRYSTHPLQDPNLFQVFPYNTFNGCIVSTPEKQFFPAQIRGSFPKPDILLSRYNERHIGSVRSACIFQNHSFLTLEQGTLHKYLREYPIKYGEIHRIEKGVEIFQSKSVQFFGASHTKCGEHMSMRAGKVDEDIVITVFTLDGTLELYRVSPSSVSG